MKKRLGASVFLLNFLFVDTTIALLVPVNNRYANYSDNALCDCYHDLQIMLSNPEVTTES
jgi:hypothetical protein